MEESSEQLHQNLNQQTISNVVELSGIGLFTGAKVTCLLSPAPVGSGILFQRTDLPDKSTIKACIDNAIAGPRSTILSNGTVKVHTIEHLMSALHALGVDNLLISLDGPEVPIGDGSAKQFVEKIQGVGLLRQEEECSFFQVREPFSVKKDGTVLIALPSEKCIIDYTLSYPTSKILSAQFYSFSCENQSYENEICQARTFSLYEDLQPLWDQGLLKHAGLENGVVIKDDIVLNPDGLRYANEMVRHKILDLLGDLFLVGRRVKGHFIGIRSGHATNLALAKKMKDSIGMQEGVLIPNER